MAATRHTLQREIFTLSDEKILSICRVSKAYKKKKTSFLCLVSTTDTPETFIIYQVKSGNEKSNFKKKQSWLLSDVRTIDGVDADSMDLELHIDKIYKWSTTNLQEKRNFVSNLYTFSFGLPQRPEFKNIPQEWMANDLSSTISSSDKTTASTDFLQSPLIMPEYQPITDKETMDLASLMDNCYYAVSNAELFMETLSKDLSILDGENIQSVLASEPQVTQLMSGIEVAIHEASQVEAQLTVYDEALGRIREAMERVGQKNNAIHIANRNARLLLEQLEVVITHLTISPEHQKILNEAELPGHKDELAVAGNDLLKAISFPLPLGLDKLSAVAEQKKKLDKLRAKFSLLVARHLNNLFIHLGNDVGETVGISNTSSQQSNLTSTSSGNVTNDFKLSTHQAIQKELEPYTELMRLLRALDQKAFTQLTKVYTKTMGSLYQRNFKFFFEEAKDRLISKRLQHHQHSHSTSKSSSSSMPKGDIETIIASISPPICLLSNETWTPQGEGILLDSVLDNVLSQLQPVCLAEQAFCITFLNLDSFVSPLTKQTNQVKDESGSCSSNSGGDDLHNNPAVSPGSANLNDLSKLGRHVNEQVRATMAAIFPSLETELTNFLSFLEKIDSFWCMYILVRLSQHVMSAQDTGSFLSMTFASALVQAKRAFDKFMQMQQQSILDAKVNRRNKCGILPYVENFGPFAKTAENIFKNSDRKIDLEKWYTKLISTMFEAIVSHSTEHHKTPPEVIKMENFHHLYDLLSQLKISVLDHERKEAKQKYQEALKAYVTRYFGRPLEKLNFFFDGVQAKVGAGVKESEISYQMAYSRQELRRVVKEYPAREVKKGLEHLYRKVEKHLCEEENLLQVVWREMQGEFIAQYMNIEELIKRCYPDSNITLEFTIQNILEFFSEIAQSH
ncbi:exocyst complex component 1 isoform X1 [Nasonia vitripennis]|uniref:Exocyst complex component Sec3 PIP2-binding N-terminal domain-containing protein n=1 Tax=Nasonia vitripennis TaxID=7425 RepID=A0A7M7QNP3_NASVI|nr:exocyst complex component 1 isoform X1 [Nasonia vitripennis]XP_031788397.1 exocyst complex component 1 isoform X1 [Nasonia vitripennis]